MEAQCDLNYYKRGHTRRNDGAKYLLGDAAMPCSEKDDTVASDKDKSFAFVVIVHTIRLCFPSLDMHMLFITEFSSARALSPSRPPLPVPSKTNPLLSLPFSSST